MEREAILELIDGLRKRAKACETLGLGHPDKPYTVGRLAGKQQAYNHAAELLRGLFDGEGDQ